MDRDVNQPHRTLHKGFAYLLLWLGMLTPAAGASAGGLEVAVSLPPIHSLTEQVMAGNGTPRLLIPAGTSPHGFSLTPSQARALANAQVVIWIGRNIETTLTKPIASLAKGARVLTLAESDGLHRLKARSLGQIGKVGRDDHHHGHEHGHGHGHDGQGEDAHYWLDPENAKVMLDAIARTLGDVDPVRQAAYAANAEKAKERINGLVHEFKARLKPLANRPFIVFHDAYQYLEGRFGLHAEGVLAIDPERPPGARHITEMRAFLKKMGSFCLFTEPQFSSRIVDALTKGTAARIGVLDPLGSGLEPGPDLYVDMLTANLRSLESCLAGIR